MVLDDTQVFVVNLLGKHAEESGKSFGAKFGAVLIGSGPSPLHQAHKTLVWPDGSMQHSFGRLSRPAPELLLAFDSLHGNGVHLPDNVGPLQAIGENVLAIDRKSKR